jgi:NYN domain
MQRESGAPFLSAVFVDYDNIYLSLKRKDEEAARRFAKNASGWIKEVELGSLITPTNGGRDTTRRRIVMNRCYGNPVPRRNNRDNSTDMNSFAFVRHHFLRAGFEVIDCPPLTAQLKNSSDIRMVMDIRDFLTHDTYFDEFIILSSDADFTPVLHRLRAHARRTVIFANEQTALPYTAISDGEIREQDLVELLLRSLAADTNAGDGGLAMQAPTGASTTAAAQPSHDVIAAEIIELVRSTVMNADRPVAIEVLADRAQRTLGHERTVGTSWAGSGSFLALLSNHLPPHLRLSDSPPFHVEQIGLGAAIEQLSQRPSSQEQKPSHQPSHQSSGQHYQERPVQQMPAPHPVAAAPEPVAQLRPVPVPAPQPSRAPEAVLAPPRRMSLTQQPLINIEQSIARIHEACQAPPLSPPDYRALFEAMAAELRANGLNGAQTLPNIAARAQQGGLEVKADDIRFVLDVVREADPWFEQGVSANIFASRFRNFVVARCRSQGLSLASDEIDLIDAWFAGGLASGLGGGLGNGLANGHGSGLANGAPAGRPAALADAGAPPPAALNTGRTPVPSMQKDHGNDPWWQAPAAGSAPALANGNGRSLDGYDEHDNTQMPRIVRARQQA